MFIAVSAIIIILALGWWRYHSKAAAARARAEEEDAYEVHGQERAHELAQLQSDLSRVKGWTPSGPGF